MGWLYSAGYLAGAGTPKITLFICVTIAAHCCVGTLLLVPVASVSLCDLSSVSSLVQASLHSSWLLRGDDKAVRPVLRLRPRIFLPHSSTTMMIKKIIDD